MNRSPHYAVNRTAAGRYAHNLNKSSAKSLVGQGSSAQAVVKIPR
jgi:hypothetical protein